MEFKTVMQSLNRSLAQLDEPTLASLRTARAHAISRHEARGSIIPLFAVFGERVPWHASEHHRRIHYWISGILLAACLLSGINYWQQVVDDDTSDLDIAIFTDEMPIQYYTD